MSGLLKIYLPGAEESVICARADGFEDRLRKAIDESQSCEMASSPNRADVIFINQIWKSRNWHDLRVFEACQFLREYSQKIVTINHDDVTTTFLPGLYVSLTSRNIQQGWALPSGYKQQYRDNDALDVDMSANDCQWLFSFRGADFSHPIRKKLTRLFNEESKEYSYVVANKKFHSHTQRDHQIYVNELLNSHFVLAPGGFSPSTYRLFEAMQYGRCPVIISDEWQPIDGVDWDKCSVRVAERDIRNLREILAERTAESLTLGQNAQKVWNENFADEIREKKMVEALISLHLNCTQPRDIESLKKFWHSNEFFYAHGWTLTQRLDNRIKRLMNSV